MSFTLLKKVFGLDASEEAFRDLGLLFDTLKDQFEQMSLDDVKRITAYAGILGKISYADMDISTHEIERMSQIFEKELSLSSSKRELLMSILLNHRVQLFSVEDHFYSRLVNEMLSREEKLTLLEAAFEVAASDGSVSTEEDAVLYDVSRSMQLTRKEFISVKRRYVEYLDVLKK